jgi:hypothetical protein
MRKEQVFKTGNYFFAVLFILISATVYGQDFGFGFGDDDFGFSSGTASSLNVSVGGEVSASMIGYIDDFSEGLDHVRLGDIFSGKLSFSAGTPFAEGVVDLKLSPSSSPISIDEAYVRAYFGNLDVTAGLRKITWGKADSFGPLDVINPLDYSQVFTEMADNVSLLSVRVARPLINASYRLGDFSKIEGVFVPWFMPHQLPRTGRWAVSQMEMLTNPPIPVTLIEPDTTTLDYAQAGLRFTTTIGSADVGAQYYYGRIPQPSVGFTFSSSSPIPQVDFLYNPYHQLGLDYAQVLFGFNVRAELAANLTDDFEGDDGSVYNPSAVWSLGFDRDLFMGINLNLQVNESIRLFQDKLGSDNILSGNFDIEGGMSLTSTRVTASLSKKFLRDELEVRAAVVCGIEDKDFAVMPALIWAKDDIRFALSGGFFGGDSEGQLGQYKDNGFLKISLAYTF